MAMTIAAILAGRLLVGAALFRVEIIVRVILFATTAATDTREGRYGASRVDNSGLSLRWCPDPQINVVTAIALVECADFRRIAVLFATDRPLLKKTTITSVVATMALPFAFWEITVRHEGQGKDPFLGTDTYPTKDTASSEMGKEKATKEPHLDGPTRTNNHTRCHCAFAAFCSNCSLPKAFEINHDSTRLHGNHLFHSKQARQMDKRTDGQAFGTFRQFSCSYVARMKYVVTVLRNARGEMRRRPVPANPTCSTQPFSCLPTPISTMMKFTALLAGESECRGCHSFLLGVIPGEAIVMMVGEKPRPKRP